MPRGSRIDAVGAVHHIMVRGIERKKIFDVNARSLFCFWAVRELGVSMASLGRRLGLSIPAISKSVARGKQIAESNGFSLT